MSKEKGDDKGTRKGYPWPASALTANEMRILVEMRDKTGKPISILLKHAVIAFETRKNYP